MDYGLRGTLPARPTLTPYIRFLFIDSHICLTLPSDLPCGDSPCVIANPSPPSGWVEDLHLLAAEHAQHTTKPLARQTLRVLHSVSHAATWRLDAPFSFSPHFGNCCEFCRLQAKVDSNPIAPHPPQTPASSFKRLWTKPLRGRWWCGSRVGITDHARHCAS